MRISDWSSDVCSSDLGRAPPPAKALVDRPAGPTYNPAMSGRPFIKMHGLGNDFVVVDARQQPFPLTDSLAKAIADRREGVGCDQLLVLERPSNGSADVFMRIRNHDGGEVGACGNGTRCVAEIGRAHV